MAEVLCEIRMPHFADFSCTTIFTATLLKAKNFAFRDDILSDASLISPAKNRQRTLPP